MREAKKVECLRFAFPSSFPVLFGKPAKLKPTRFVWMQFQPKLPPFRESLQKTIRICLMQES
jgi:hypothetical protein